eukprot:s1977_g10.t1
MLSQFSKLAMKKCCIASGVGPQFGRPAGCCGALCKETRPGSADICHSKGSAHRLDGIGKKDLFCATPLQRGASAKPESSRRDRRTSPCGRRWKSCLLEWASARMSCLLQALVAGSAGCWDSA